MKTVSGVASSMKEMLNRNLATGAADSHTSTLADAIPKLHSEYSYFKL